MLQVFVADIAARISGTDPSKPVERIFESRQRAIDGQIVGLEDAIEIRREAVALAATYAFDTNPKRDLVTPVLPE